MILCEAATGAAVRAGEAVIAGRRIAGRVLPYGAEAEAVRFDPVDRRFVFPRPDPALRPGPADPQSWRDAWSRVPAGPVLIGPSSRVEPLWGSGFAAARAALDAGRPAYLLDTDPDGLLDLGDSIVVLCSWRPGRAVAAFPGLERARRAGATCGGLFPLLPGWTDADDVLDALGAAAASGGASSLTPIVPSSEGEDRRAIVEARARVDPEEADRFFEVVHHGEWPGRLAGRVEAARAAARRHGLALLPPRPRGSRAPRGNAAAAARLEEEAELTAPGEHRAALLHAAVRWIDETARDLSAVEREGNFARIFPFDGRLLEAAASALRDVPSP
jgi:hypothetical protein